MGEDSTKRTINIFTHCVSIKFVRLLVGIQFVRTCVSIKFVYPSVSIKFIPHSVIIRTIAPRIVRKFDAMPCKRIVTRKSNAFDKPYK